MTGVILYRLFYSGDPFAIPMSAVAYLDVGQDPDDPNTWRLKITTVDGSSFTPGEGTKEYCERKFQILTSAISENQGIIDVTEW